MGQKEIEAFLTYLTVEGKVAASTQNQAFNALLFLYKNVFGLDVFTKIEAYRAKRPQRLPTVLEFDETMAIIDAMYGVFRLIAKVLYGCGLRGIECVRLRVKDIDFQLHQIIVRNGKGQKDRVTMLPYEVKSELPEHLAHVKKIHEKDLRDGYGEVFLPNVLERKYKVLLQLIWRRTIFKSLFCRRQSLR